MKSATEQISDAEARSVADRAYKILNKSAEGAKSKVVSKDEVFSVVRGVVGDTVSRGAAGQLLMNYVSYLAMMAANMRSFDPKAWMSGVGSTPLFAGCIEEVRARLEVASKLPAE